MATTTAVPTTTRTKRIGLVLGPLLLVLLLLFPPPGLEFRAERLLAVAALVIVFWVTEAVPLPVTALLGVALAVALGASDTATAFAGFADPTVFLLIGSFFLVTALQAHGLDRRIGYALMSHPWVGESTYRTLWALGLTAALVSAWVNNSATAAMLYPATLAIAAVAVERLGPLDAARYRTALLLMLAYGVSIGGMITPVGTPTNLLGIALIETSTGLRIPFMTWVLVGGVTAVILLPLLFGLLLLLSPPGTRRIPGQQVAVRAAARSLGPWTRSQKLVAAVGAITIALWLTPGLLELIGGEEGASAWFRGRLPEGIVALIAAGVLFILPGENGTPLLRWEQVATIDWGTVLLLGGGAALGRLAIETGLAEELGRAVLGGGWLARTSVLLLVAIVLALVLSEVASNTAAVNLVVPVLLGMAVVSGTSIAPPAVAATLGASLGFMLPVATPPNALVYGSRHVPVRDMLRVGLLLDLGGVITIWLVMMTLGVWALS